MMKKAPVVAAPRSLSNVSVPVAPFNWKICCLCQKPTGKLVCPLDNPIESRRASGYVTIASNLEKLRDCNYVLPCGKNVNMLDEGDGIQECLLRHVAKWHKNCTLKFLPPKFESTLADAIEKKAVPQTETEAVEEEASDSRPSTRSQSTRVNPKELVCFLCGKPGTPRESLRRCGLDTIAKNIRLYATALKETRIIGLIETGGDVFAQEAKYHRGCFTSLYNRYRSLPSSRKSFQEDEEDFCGSIAFAELVLFIEDKLSTPSIVFRMGEIMSMYSARVTELYGKPVQEHSTRLREKILARLPSLKAEKWGREYVLMSKGANLMPVMPHENQDDDTFAFLRFAKKVRKSISSHKVSFTGSFPERCEEKSIPGPLLAVVNTLLYGSSKKIDCGATYPVISICQLIMANYKEATPKGDIVRIRKDREPPLPLYLGLSCYGKSRDNSWINEMHRRGLSVSSTRVTEVTTQLCRMVVQRAKDENLLRPSNLLPNVLTLAALDNIDVKRTSNTSVGEFHGTGISIFQCPVKDDEVAKPEAFMTSYEDVSTVDGRSIPDLPDFYSVVPDCVVPNQPLISSYSIDGTYIPEGEVSTLWTEEAPWLRSVREHLSGNTEPLTNVSWSAHHANRAPQSSMLPAISALLPLFDEKSSNVAMIKHGMDIVRQLTNRLNAQQAPVLCVDQPLYALAKKIQWTWPDIYGKEKYLILLGPLHIELSFLRLLGQLMEGCGWTTIVTHAEITTSGAAAAMLKVTHIKRAREFHQLTAVVLYALLMDAYEYFHPDGDVSLEEWARESAQKSPTFCFWLLVLNLEILLLVFVRSVRQGQYMDFRGALKRMAPWYFLFDHHNYARWLTVHIMDLEELGTNIPEIEKEFLLGKFVVHKTTKPFSALGVDHAHEQQNARVKGVGGAVGLTHDPATLRRWTVGGPEVTRLLREFNGSTNDGDGEDVCDEEDETLSHHEQKKAYQTRFFDMTVSLKDAFLQYENPFTNQSSELVAVDSGIVTDKKCVADLYEAEKEGLSLYKHFVKERLIERSKSIFDAIPKKNIKFFGAKKKTKKNNAAVNELKTDVSLFSRLFIVSRNRQLDLDAFFAHENHPYPPSIAINGLMRSGNKAQLVHILQKMDEGKDQPTTCGGLVFDGAFLAHNIKPRQNSSTFESYVDQFVSYLQHAATNLTAKRIDVVWDLYLPCSLKSSTRSSRGKGVRRQGLPNKGTLPSDWDDYLRDDLNKKELFSFLAQAIVNHVSGLQVVTNIETDIKSVNGSTSLSVASTEEADGRIILHVNDMVMQGTAEIVVVSTDTDVMVLAVSFFHQLNSKGLRKLWVLFGSGRNRRYISIHVIADALGQDKSQALRGFHAFTGCDTVSFFGYRGKKTAWSAWKTKETTRAFALLSQPSGVEPTQELVKLLEEFTASMYGISSKHNCSGINNARKYLFATESKPIGAIPPSRAALIQHIKRAQYQAGHVWGRANEEFELPPSPEGWGWTNAGDSWTPLWTTLPEVWDACRSLDTCGCNTGCESQRCSCRRSHLPCTLACKKCQGSCANKSNLYHYEEPGSDEAGSEEL